MAAVNMDVYWEALTMVLPAGLVVFGVGETYALKTGREPYTGWIRKKLGIDPPQPRRVWLAPAFALILGGFFVWFIPHIEKWAPW